MDTKKYTFEDLVFQAKLCDQTRRYEDMRIYMTEAAKKGRPLNKE